MEGYEVYDRVGEHCGRVVEERDDYLIVESGWLFKTERALPRVLTTLGDGHRVDLVVTRELVDDSPALGNDIDRDALAAYYAEAIAFAQHSTDVALSH
jgi:hypothetical protein